MKEFWIEPETKKLNKKKLIILIIFLLIVISLTTLIIIYNKNQVFREWMDKNIYRKEVTQNNVTTIELNETQNSNIYAFNKYIGILNRNKFSIYGNTGNEENTLEIQITNPVFNSANRFLVIGEAGGQKVYLITDKDISWEATIEGTILQVLVNQNGYVAVVMEDAINKTVIQLYNTEGKPLFKTYSRSNRTTDVAISNDNKYLAIAEIDTSGTIIQSNIKIISVEKATTDPTESVEKTYTCESDKLLVDIKYQNKDKLVCMYTDSIKIIENDEETTLVENKNKKAMFQTIELNENVVSIEERSSGLFTADSIVNIVNVDNKSTKEYKIESVTKEIYACGDIIAINLGTEIEFINISGMLVKRYIANQEISDVAMSNNIAGIIYRDKIEIVNL